MALPTSGSLLETSLVSLPMIVIAVVFPLLFVALAAHFIGGSPELLFHLLVLQALDVVGTMAISTGSGFGVAHQKLTTVDAEAVFPVIFNVAVLASYGGDSSTFPGHGLMGKGNGEAEVTTGARKILVNRLVISTRVYIKRLFVSSQVLITMTNQTALGIKSESKYRKRRS